MGILRILFSFSGRIPRSTYWLAVVGLSVALMAVAIAGMSFLVPQPGALGQAASPAEMMDSMRPYMMGLGLFFIISLWPSLAIIVKRLHDRNKSGWWLALPYLPWLIIIGVVMMNPQLKAFTVPVAGAPPQIPAVDPATGAILAACMLIATIASIWLFVVVGFLRGTNGPNRFGEDPLGGVAGNETPQGNEWAS